MKSLVALWIILILNKTAVAQFKDGFMFHTSICKGKNGGLLPMFGKCRGYYICNEGKAVAGSCDEYSRFNPLTLHCDDADNVICPYETPDDDDDADMDTSEADTLEFDSDEIEEPPIYTKPPKQLPKPNKHQIADLCFSKKNGVALPKAGSCTEYYMCRSKMAHLRRCPGRQHFSPTLKLCMKASAAKCSIGQVQVQLQVSSTEEPKSSPAVTAGLCSDEKQDALVPHRNDCGKFLLCSNMMFLVMDCPQGLHFNAKLRRCDYPKIAQCEVQKKPTKRNKRKLSKKSKPKGNPF
ncbi:probable chitinase 10 [Drosophila montana]|uniref:probable chitinase 10 n=1 Tax=Drosophila montana TaxID=40370 RepID=UPI00313D32E0